MLDTSDAYTLLSFIIELVYPTDYFAKDTEQLARHSHLTALALAAKALKPKLVTKLKAVLKRAIVDKQRKVWYDYGPFVETVKLMGAPWFDQLFAGSLSLA
jgi:hypothetical protein